jgi:glycosyltransferase involved in cell wall biosynthesis
MKNNPHITYAITVCNELNELTILLTHLQKYKHIDDEILIQYDESGVSDEVLQYLQLLKTMNVGINVIGFPLNGDFASFKNNLKNHAKGIYILQIDADELPHPFLLDNLRTFLEINKEVDLFFIPRVNTVDGITEDDVRNWGWKITKMDTQTATKKMDTDSDEYKYLKKLDFIISEENGEVKYYKPIINWPDAQTRLYRRTSEIEWVGKVHEKIKGYNTLSIFPLEEIYSFYHPKEIDRQRKQNKFYETI